MHIKSIIIDGFKSYGKRVEITGFDPYFNAITGLNGSGKSNILDSICFVLGITNLRSVRAESLQDLVYKQGQAGVTKASVTLIFDNSDKKSSPIGYEQYEEISVTRQVVVGGKNKYLINGINVQVKRVSDLFCSVQLNVNNPHFLIMQGRITKVLNMKPLEILAMVEEAAGTKMYENKKITAEKTIEKKDNKLRQLNDVINNDIAPRIQKLKEEQGQYLEYQKVVRDLERLSKIYIAWQYTKAKAAVEKNRDATENVLKEIEESKATIKNSEAEAAAIDEQVAEIQKKIDEVSGSQLKELDNALAAVEKEESVAKANEKVNKDTLAKEIKRKTQMEKSLKEDEAALSHKLKELENSEEVFQKIREDIERDAKALAEAQKRYEAASAGMLADEKGETATVQERLMRAKEEMSNAETELKQSEMKLTHFKKTLAEKQRELKATEKEHGKDMEGFSQKEREVKAVEAQLQKLNYEDGTLERLSAEKRQLATQVRRLKDEVDTFEARYPYLFFHYKDPEPNFNKNSVKGVLCRLMKLKDESKAMALESVAGGRLYNVIADNDVTCKKLLERGELQRRTTFIPLNKITSRPLEPGTIRAAEQMVGKENIDSALSLVEYDQKYKGAFEYAFGNAFVTVTMDMAREVTFNPRISKKCVTIEGDVFDPQGVITGGAVSKETPVLLQLKEIILKQEELREKQERIRQLDCEIQKLSKVSEQYSRLKSELDVKRHQLSLVKERIEHTTHHRLAVEVDQIKEQMKQLEEKVQASRKIQSEGTKKIKELEYQVTHAKELLERQIKDAETEMKRIKAKADAGQKHWQNREQEFETLKLEVEELKLSLETSKKELAELEEELKKMEEKQEEFKVKREELQTLVKEKKEAVRAMKEQINSQAKEVQTLMKKKSDMLNKTSELQLRIKKLEHEAKKCENDAKDSEKQVKTFIDKYEWIPEEEQFFGQPKGAYDYNSMDMRQTGQTISTLEERKTELGRKLNIRAMNMLGKEEEQYNDLIKKKQIVETDRAKIVSVLQELDEKKKQALRKAWAQVNNDFSSIFTTLLPGAQACLKPPDGKDVLDGLEVKVGFGGLWKEGLQELSGGQRSLVALSLILAMLLFKPAPIYILDEVDAALDLSHTQNIGTMLRTHFKHSQFIVVSLKDGMFNNANVLFKTQFVDGMSTVRRFAQNPGSSVGSEEAGPSKKKKK